MQKMKNACMDDVHKRHYISGETYFYLGRRYQLKVQIEPEASIGIKMIRGRLEVTLPKQLNNQREVVKGLLNKPGPSSVSAAYERSDTEDELGQRITAFSGYADAEAMGKLLQRGTADAQPSSGQGAQGLCRLRPDP